MRGQTRSASCCNVYKNHSWPDKRAHQMLACEFLQFDILVHLQSCSFWLKINISCLHDPFLAIHCCLLVYFLLWFVWCLTQTSLGVAVNTMWQALLHCIIQDIMSCRMKIAGLPKYMMALCGSNVSSNIRLWLWELCSLHPCNTPEN